jgi:hypothetical protein
VAETFALNQQAIPHTTIPNRTNHFSLVNTLGESEFDSARSIEGGVYLFPPMRLASGAFGVLIVPTMRFKLTMNVTLICM